MNSVAGLAAMEPGGGTWKLHPFGPGAPLLHAQPIETRLSATPAFSRDGRLLAIGNEDGTVHVYELGEMKQSLGTIKLGW